MNHHRIFKEDFVPIVERLLRTNVIRTLLILRFVVWTIPIGLFQNIMFGPKIKSHGSIYKTTTHDLRKNAVQYLYFDIVIKPCGAKLDIITNICFPTILIRLYPKLLQEDINNNKIRIYTLFW